MKNVKHFVGTTLLAAMVAAAGAAYSQPAHDMSSMNMSGGMQMDHHMSGDMKMAGATSDSKVEMSQGEIKKVDVASGKLTIKHGPLKNLGMDGMTMVFRVKEPSMVKKVKVGDKVNFVAENVDGALTVVKLEAQQ